ncbi:T9SS type A sorting domain-containing protein [bacterium]|nr:T9SS type A sorting domain-containing protein [bacterium]
MQSRQFILIALMVIALFFTVNTTAIGEVTVDPTGIAVWVEGADDAVELEMILSNSSEDDVAYRLRYFDVDREQNERQHRLSGPRRDDPGDIIQEVEVEHPGALGMGFDHENNVMWITHIIQAQAPNYITGYEWDGAEITNIVNDFEVPQMILGGTYYNGVIYCTIWQRAAVVRYTVDGDDLGDINVAGQGVMACAADPETGYLYVICYSDVFILVLDINDDFNEVGRIENVNVQDGDLADFRGRIGWAPDHEDGHLWLGHHYSVEDGCSKAWQLNIDEDWNWEEVQHFNVASDVRSPGIAHDGVNLWVGNENSAIINIIDDGINEPNWLMADPQRGVIGANEDETIDITITPGEIEQGVWEMLLRIDLDQAEEQRDDFEATSIEMAVVMSYNTPVAQVSGSVTSVGNDAVIENARVDLDYYAISRFTDNEGMYNLNDIPFGDYEFTFSAEGYLPTTIEVGFFDEVVEVDAELYHGECIPSTREIDVQLEPDMQRQINFDVTNEGNGPLTYTLEKRLIGGADAEPWELRFDGNLEEFLDDDKLNGVVFVNGNFYVSGGNNGESPNKIYVINKDGELIGNFDQECDTRYGIRDLAWDGELIWGVDDNMIYGFTTEGEVQAEFADLVDNCRSITWDSDNELLWVCGITTDYYRVDREGNLIEAVEHPRDLRTYGLAYWTEDPEGYPLYAITNGENELLDVKKINLENREVMHVNTLDTEGSGPAGIEITSDLDVYSWVFMGMLQNPDRLAIWQIESRKDWFDVEPTAGVIEPNESEEFTLTLNTDGLPADNIFEGVLAFTHDGIDGETLVPVTLNIQEGRVETDRTIQLRMGWNLVSVNLQPEDEENIVGLLSPLVDENQLIMMKNSRGEFYRPEYDYNDIPGWYVNEAYQMLVSANTELTLHGVTVLRDDPIDLSQGWQAVSYYPNFEIEATVAFSGIVDNLIIAKDGRGNFYLPEWDHFSNMGELSPGQGYWIKVSEDARLIYQTGEENNALFGNLHSKPSLLPSHPNTSENMSLLVKCDPALTGEVGVYSENMLIGSGVLDNGSCGIALWGDDILTEQIDGAIDGDALEIRYYSGVAQQNVEYKIIAGEMTYHKDAYAVIDLAVKPAALLSEFGITSIYPNPFNAQTRITFSLNEDSMVDLAAFDLSGRRISQLAGGKLSAGMHNVHLNGLDMPSGIYFIRLNACGQQSEWKVALVK